LIHYSPINFISAAQTVASNKITTSNVPKFSLPQIKKIQLAQTLTSKRNQTTNSSLSFTRSISVNNPLLPERNGITKTYAHTDKRTMYVPARRDDLATQYKYRRKDNIQHPEISSSITSNTQVHAGKATATKRQFINAAAEIAQSSFNDHFNIPKTFYETMNPRFHQAPSLNDDTDDVVRRISQADEREADAESALDFYMKMSRDGTPMEEKPTTKITAQTTPDFEDKAVTSKIGRPVDGGSSPGVLLTKRRDVIKPLQLRTNINVGGGKTRNDSLVGESTSKNRILATKHEKIETTDEKSENSQSEKTNSKKSQSELNNSKRNDVKNKIDQSEGIKLKQRAAESEKGLLEIVDLKTASTQTAFSRTLSGNNSVPDFAKDNLILDYATRYRGKGRLVADFSRGVEHARLYVYDLKTGEKPSSTDASNDSERKRSIIEETVARMKRFARADDMVNENAEKRMIGKF